MGAKTSALHFDTFLCAFAVDSRRSHSSSQGSPKQETTMKFLCLIYLDERVLEDLSKRQFNELRDESLAYDERLRESGHFVTANALESTKEAVTLRLRGEEVSVTDGPFAETKEQVGGFILIEARDLHDAVRVASKIPAMRLGGVEVRAIKDLRADSQNA
jgi:hypothetical protein